MPKNIIETPSERRQESKKLFRNRAGDRKRFTPASREEWTEALATAERYY